MSYTSLYGIKSDFTAMELKQYKNSWLFLPQIYKILGEKYLNEKDTYKVLFTSKNLDKLERNVSKSKRTEDRVLWLLVNQQIFFTKDKTFIADCIQKFFMEDVRYYHPDNMDLIEWHNKIRKDISALDEKKYPYFIFNATTF